MGGVSSCGIERNTNLTNRYNTKKRREGYPSLRFLHWYHRPDNCWTVGHLTEKGRPILGSLFICIQELRAFPQSCSGAKPG